MQPAPPSRLLTKLTEGPAAEGSAAATKTAPGGSVSVAAVGAAQRTVRLIERGAYVGESFEKA